MIDDRLPRDPPPPDRPSTAESYGIPAGEDGLLEWPVVEDRLTAARAYWVTTVTPDGRPHARPTWGVWLDGTLHCGGGSETRWVRNLATDPRIAVHGASTEEAVIVEGMADRLDRGAADSARLDRIDRAYEAKYGIPHGTPVFAIRPHVVFAWSDFPADATRWRFKRSRRSRER